MSYLAIARKYRPATFDEMVGQEHVTRTLKNALARKRIHHAFLFSGARGVGKTTAARALARALNCAQGPTAEPCGSCPSCLEITNGNSPDLIEIDGASNNSVDDIRDLRETVRYAPTRGKYKIYLIDEVHMLSKGAFNALLKTLEEPPAHVVFIFATTESNRIPETILSRVQRFDFKRIPANGVAQRLKEIADREGVALSEGALRLIARAGDGSMRDAQSLLDQVISYAGGSDRAITDAEAVEALGLIDRGLLYDMLDGLIAGAPDRCLDVIERVHGYGFELSEFTAEVLETVRNATFLRLSPSARKHIDLAPDEITRLETLTRDVDAEVLTRVFTALLEVHDEVSRATRPRIVLEMAVARLATTRPLAPVGALLGRIEDLERRLRQGGAPAPVAGLRGARSPRSPRTRDDPPASDDEAHPAAPRVEPAPTSIRVVRPIPPPAAPKPPEAAARGDDRWARLQGELRAIGGASKSIAEGIPELRDGVLRVTMRSTRALAEARRELSRAEVAEALARSYPEKVGLELKAPPEGAAFAAEAFAHDVKQDPAFRRIVEKLGAQVGRVTPSRPPGQEE